ncbi:hypothetical protein AAG570_000236 [Ranatra chinensis]|uniref:Uncharacterized protein n=1 Tax=Ranatra chinensis TaxID=642074 RepID=A0ABD0YWI2_9HEMI
MASKRRNMFRKNKTQETTENDGVCLVNIRLSKELISALGHETRSAGRHEALNPQGDKEIAKIRSEEREGRERSGDEKEEIARGGMLVVGAVSLLVAASIGVALVTPRDSLRHPPRSARDTPVVVLIATRPDAHTPDLNLPENVSLLPVHQEYADPNRFRLIVIFVGADGIVAHVTVRMGLISGLRMLFHPQPLSDSVRRS